MEKKKNSSSHFFFVKGMDSSVALSGQSKKLKSHEENNSLPITKRPVSRRTQSFSSTSPSSSSSSSSSFGSLSFSLSIDESPWSPITPLRSSSGIPFSWEQHPGIPKNYAYFTPSSSSKKKDPSLLLPLPPAAKPTSSKRFNFEEIFSIRKKSSSESSKRDPFLAALATCSRDQEEDCWKVTKVSRTLSDRLGFFDASCKRACAVSDSKVLLPRSSRIGYDLLSRRRSG